MENFLQLSRQFVLYVPVPTARGSGPQTRATVPRELLPAVLNAVILHTFYAYENTIDLDVPQTFALLGRGLTKRTAVRPPLIVVHVVRG